jgi:Fe-Mn family superoxide dismutase
MATAFDGTEYVLPRLPYDYDALEPHYDARTVEIHHGRHHAGYVRGLNSTLAKLSAAREQGDMGEIKDLSRNLAFHGSGHVLHCLFWHSMKPGKSSIPDSLATALDESFGSVEAAKKHFAGATKAVEGSGWGVLAYEPISGKLLVLQAEKHQNLAIWGVVPLLVCDVWEHAYYLKYANNRGDWVDNFMEIANFGFADYRLKMAKKLR